MAPVCNIDQAAAFILVLFTSTFSLVTTASTATASSSTPLTSDLGSSVTTTAVKQSATTNCPVDYVCFDFSGEQQSIHWTFLLMIGCLGGGVFLIFIVIIVSVCVCWCDAKAGLNKAREEEAARQTYEPDTQTEMTVLAENETATNGIENPAMEYSSIDEPPARISNGIPPGSAAAVPLVQEATYSEVATPEPVPQTSTDTAHNDTPDINEGINGLSDLGDLKQFQSSIKECVANFWPDLSKVDGQADCRIKRPHMGPSISQDDHGPLYDDTLSY